MAAAAANALATTDDGGVPLATTGAAAGTATDSARRCACVCACACACACAPWPSCCMERDTRGGVVTMGDLVTVADGSSDKPTATTLWLLTLYVMRGGI